jgi:hypothetical protein
VAAIAVATAGALAAHPVRIDAAGGLSAIDNPVVQETLEPAHLSWWTSRPAVPADAAEGRLP